ncbi:MAG: hypothetical protein ACTHMS_23420 [Jatrophihabitans sp.]|uniref:hypothetical protein n=1 Tax=Jatrophihabitans sp. TaxID=1932789 RepID=UPI003F7D9F18
MIRRVYPDPWKRFARDWPDIPIKFADLGDIWALTRWRDGRPIDVLLHSRLTQVERRVAITHECEHLDRGAPCQTLKASIEQRVITATARWLLPDIHRLADALAVYDMHRAATELWVTFPLLMDRIKSLTEQEWLIIEQRREAA